MNRRAAKTKFLVDTVISLLLVPGTLLAGPPVQGVLDHIQQRNSSPLAQIQVRVHPLNPSSAREASPNATSTTAAYGQVTYRTLHDLTLLLGDRLNQPLKELAPGSRILLPGGGLGLYGFELERMGYQITMITPHDFVRDQFVPLLSDKGRVLANFRKFEKDLPEPGAVASVGGIAIPAFNRIGKVFGIPYPASIFPPRTVPAFPSAGEYWQLRPGVTDEKFIRDFFVFSDVAKAKLLGPTGMVSRPSFTILEGTLFEMLHDIPDGSLNMVIDFLDGIYYSAYRWELLQLIYQKLAPDGVLIFLTRPQYDYVKLLPESVGRFSGKIGANQGWVFLHEFLRERLPNVFDHEERTVHIRSKIPELRFSIPDHDIKVPVLTMKKSRGGPPSLDLPLRASASYRFETSQTGCAAPITQVVPNLGTQDVPFTEYLESAP
jgi:SAM-dependent methyltransferase